MAENGRQNQDDEVVREDVKLSPERKIEKICNDVELWKGQMKEGPK